jgi:hypothetical protein
MEEHEIIDAYNQLLYNRYQQYDLICLSDNEYQYKGENVIALNNPAVVTAAKAGLIDHLNGICKTLKMDSSLKNPNISQGELFSATADLKYRLGTLYLYQPYIINLSNSFGYHRGKKHYQYFQTRDDARFNKELPIAFECLYKFWQRLADYLTAFFPMILLEKGAKTYFLDPFQYISKHHSHLETSENYKWLKEFATKTYPVFNKHRKFFVHYSGYDTHFFNNFLNANQDDSKAIEELDLERQNWTPFLKEQLEYCNEGYLKLMYFLNELIIELDESGEFIYQLQ